MNNDLPPELQQFAAIFDAKPGPVQDIVQYCVCRLLCETGKMRLVETLPGESGAVCVFETIAGDRFSVTRLPISKEDEAALVEQLRGIFEEE